MIVNKIRITLRIWEGQRMNQALSFDIDTRLRVLQWNAQTSNFIHFQLFLRTEVAHHF